MEGLPDLSSIVPGGLYRPLDDSDPEPDFFTDDELAGEVEVPTDVDRFDERISEDVEGLLYLGALSKTVEIGSHSITIRTLKAGEELACAQIIKEFDGTMARGRAITLARVAASIDLVDGQPLQTALGPGDTLSAIRAKYEYIKRNWYWPVVEAIYLETEDLLVRQALAMEEVVGKSKASRG